MRLRGALMGLVLASSLSTQNACLFRKKKPTPPPAQMPTPKPAAPAKPEPMPPPPKVDTQTPLSTVPAPPEQIDLPEPPPQPPRRPRRPAPSATQTVPPETPPPQQPAPEPPKLVQLLTPAEQRRYQGELEKYLRNAEAIVATAGTRTLNSQQADLVVRIRAFAQQAREQREQDLMTARNLAQRADVLARDLQRSLR